LILVFRNSRSVVKLEPLSAASNASAADWTLRRSAPENADNGTRIELRMIQQDLFAAEHSDLVLREK